MREKKLYALSDGSLPIGDQGAQSIHAVAAWIKENGFKQWNNEIIVVAVVPSAERLTLLCKKLDSKLVKYTKFHEPDMANRLTAIACLTDSNIFDKFKLMGATL
jgi:hypothetical protein